MIGFDVMIGALVSLISGLDRVAILQLMLSRPIVAAPLVALLQGEPQVGLQIGLLVELLWLARLPVGAAVPPDDTQVSVASSVLVIMLGDMPGSAAMGGLELILLTLMVAIPLGKFGQFFDHYARHRNNALVRRVESACQQDRLFLAEWLHLRGLINFSLAALSTYAVILVGGIFLVPLLWPLLHELLGYSSDWLALVFPLVGIAVILGTINVNRALTLFCAAFGMAFLLLWLV